MISQASDPKYSCHQDRRGSGVRRRALYKGKAHGLKKKIRETEREEKNIRKERIIKPHKTKYFHECHKIHTGIIV